MVQFASKSCMILTVNNLSESEEDVQKIWAAVERIGTKAREKLRSQYNLFSS